MYAFPPSLEKSTVEIRSYDRTLGSSLRHKKPGTASPPQQQACWLSACMCSNGFAASNAYGRRKIGFGTYLFKMLPSLNSFRFGQNVAPNELIFLSGKINTTTIRYEPCLYCTVGNRTMAGYLQYCIPSFLFSFASTYTCDGASLEQRPEVSFGRSFIAHTSSNCIGHKFWRTTLV